MAGKANSCRSNMTDTSGWTNWNGSFMSVTSNQLTITVPANTSVYHNVQSPMTYDLTLDSAFVQVPAVTNATSAETQFVMQLDGSNQLVMNKSGSNLLFRYKLTGTNHDTSVAYSASNHKWWRFRHDGTSINWETAPDNGFNAPGTWTVQRTVATPIAITSLNYQMVAGDFGAADATPGSGTFANLNLPSPAAFFG